MYNDILKRLESFGYAYMTADDWVINYLIEKVTNTIKNECNIDAIPDGLYQIAVDMVCGEFLMMKKASGVSSINIEAAVKSISEGDTAITYAIADNAITTFDGLINYLMFYNKPQFATYRRFKW